MANENCALSYLRILILEFICALRAKRWALIPSRRLSSLFGPVSIWAIDGFGVYRWLVLAFIAYLLVHWTSKYAALNLIEVLLVI